MLKRTRYLLLIGLWGLLAGTSAAQACTQWSAAGVYNVRQSNGFTISLTVFQSGATVSGRASYPGESGVIEGTVSGHQFNFVVYWNAGARGAYDGFIQDTGAIIGGTTYDMDNQSSNATWNTKKRLTCAVN